MFIGGRCDWAESTGRCRKSKGDVIHEKCEVNENDRCVLSKSKKVSKKASSKPKSTTPKSVKKVSKKSKKESTPKSVTPKVKKSKKDSKKVSRKSKKESTPKSVTPKSATPKAFKKVSKKPANQYIDIDKVSGRANILFPLTGLSKKDIKNTKNFLKYLLINMNIKDGNSVRIMDPNSSMPLILHLLERMKHMGGTLGYYNTIGFKTDRDDFMKSLKYFNSGIHRDWSIYALRILSKDIQDAEENRTTYSTVLRDMYSKLSRQNNPTAFINVIYESIEYLLNNLNSKKTSYLYL
jgi:hypothetical protein